MDQFDQMRCGRLGITMRSRRNKWSVRYFETMLDFMKEQTYRIWAVMYNGTPKELNHYEANDSLQAWLADPSINPYVQAASGDNEEVESSFGGGSIRREQVAAQMRTPTRGQHLMVVVIG